MLIRALQLLPPEIAHRLALRALRHGLVPGRREPPRPRLATTLWGQAFPHPLGLAAGFDKNAEAFGSLLRQGFAFVEVGTVTPRPQAGNPTPRLFRLASDRALINRMGFNNRGLDAVRARLAARVPSAGVVGANIGANWDTPDPLQDYVAALAAIYAHADYVAVNVSSPNTPGLRGLQERSRLRALLDALLGTRAGLAGGQAPKPLVLKVAPDLAPEAEADIAEVALEIGIDGLIVSNTIVERPAGLIGPHRNERGGLSGPPLFAPSTAQLQRFYRLTSGQLPLIGVGGITSGADAYAKIRAGASLLQLYTTFTYRGPAAIGRILADLDRLLTRDGYERLDCAVGTAAQA